MIDIFFFWLAANPCSEDTYHVLVTLLQDFLHASTLPVKVCTGKLAFHE